MSRSSNWRRTSSGFSEFDCDWSALVESYMRRQVSLMSADRDRVQQCELEFRSWGGRRRGAGRKPSGPRRSVAHRTREELAPRHPVQVTVRLHEGLPRLRRDAARAAIESAFRAARVREDLRLVQYSLQTNHAHLIAEAEDENALSRGMKGLLVRIARALNRLWGRKGSVFSDRYHARQLRTPREVRATLVYVLQNARRHGRRIPGIDLFSSGRWFDGWSRKVVFASRSPMAAARSWLLRVGWRLHGLIGIEERPRSAST
jgi:putative transposase